MKANSHVNTRDPNDVEPGFIAIIMIFVSLVFPVGFILQGSIVPIMIIVALIYPILGLLLVILNILYVYWIVRYYQNKSTKRSVYILGLLSITLPTVVAFCITGLMGSFLVICPFPIQFVAGLILLWKIERPEPALSRSTMRPDLVGVSPNLIAVLMALVTLIVPLGYIPPNSYPIPYIGFDHIWGAYGLIWALGSNYFLITGFLGSIPALLEQTMTLGLFNMLLVLQIVRYYQGITSQRRVLVVGIASIAYPVLLSLITTLTFRPLTLMQIVWPIPIQFIIALILLYRIPGPELVA